MINSRASRSISLVLVSVLLTLGFMSLSLQKALASPNEVVVCSKSNRGTLGNDTSIFVSMNARGNEVAFQSDATNLRYMNPTSGTQVFYKNLDNHRVVECSSSTSGVEGNGTSQSPSISDDGKFVALASQATNLIDGTTTTNFQVYRKDVTSGETRLCSTSASGVIGNFNSDNPSISADGRYVAFVSTSSNLIDGTTTLGVQVFRKDLLTGEIRLVPVSTLGAVGSNFSFNPSISGDGRYVAFHSYSPNLIDGRTISTQQVYRKDLASGELVLCSQSTSGTMGDNQAGLPSLSSDGRYVAFESGSTNLIDGVTTGFQQIFRKDLVTGEIKLGSSSTSGTVGDNQSDYPSISHDGRYVAFHSSAANLIDGSPTTDTQVFRKDLAGGDVKLCSISASGATGGGAIYSSISGNGVFVSFSSNATNLVDGETTSDFQIFRKELATPSTWYLAEGSTNGGMETYVLVQNPGATPVHVNIKFQTEAGEQVIPALQGVAIPAASRSSFYVNDYVTTYNVSTKVEAVDGQVICERSVYGGERTWATDSIGATMPSSTWYLAEGSTNGGMETYVLVQNPGATPVHVNIKFQTEAGEQVIPALQGVAIPAASRSSFYVNDYVTTYNVSTKVEAVDGQVICERSVYGGERTWATDSIGATMPSSTWYLAEGSTNGGMETYVLVQNPGATPVHVNIKFQTEAGEQVIPALQGVAIPAASRSSFYVNDYVTTYNVSTKVEAVDGQVICERSVYGGERTWATDSIGATP